MPYSSKAQARFMWAKHPKIAKRWADEGHTTKGLPEHVKAKPKKRIVWVKKHGA